MISGFRHYRDLGIFQEMLEMLVGKKQKLLQLVVQVLG